MANGRRFGCVTGLVRDSACCLSASTLACVRQSPAITLPAIRTASGSCCGRRELVPERITYLDDDRLAEWGYGITNLVPRPSPGIDDLRPAEYVDGWTALERKIRRFRPGIVAFVGVTLYRAIQPLLASENGAGRARVPALAVGRRPETIHGARVFVVPNPSGRNANFSYAEMLGAFKGLRRALLRIEALS